MIVRIHGHILTAAVLRRGSMSEDDFGFSASTTTWYGTIGVSVEHRLSHSYGLRADLPHHRLASIGGKSCLGCSNTSVHDAYCLDCQIDMSGGYG